MGMPSRPLGVACARKAASSAAMRHLIAGDGDTCGLVPRTSMDAVEASSAPQPVPGDRLFAGAP